MESGAVLAGTLAYASRVFSAAGQADYAQTLKTAAIRAWQWLLTQSDDEAVDVREVKVWAAAEIWRLDPTVTSARAYVDGFYPSNWSGRFFNVFRYDTHAALSYLQTPGATPEVVGNMRASVASQVDYLFASDDLYRNGMPDWAYHWGSNGPRAAQGVFLLIAGRLGLTGGHTAVECARHALDLLHFFHGQNALNMVYLTNMAALGGEHSSFQFFHLWFGDSRIAYSRTNFLGKPAGINEPDYPYFTGTDNHGISDNKTSTLGPPPGFVPGGPNAGYGGTASPPRGAGALNRFYRDWADNTISTAQTWEITENSIGYQGPYIALAALLRSPVGSQSAAGSDESSDPPARGERRYRRAEPHRTSPGCWLALTPDCRDPLQRRVAHRFDLRRRHGVSNIGTVQAREAIRLRDPSRLLEMAPIVRRHQPAPVEDAVGDDLDERRGHDRPARRRRVRATESTWTEPGARRRSARGWRRRARSATAWQSPTS